MTYRLGPAVSHVGNIAYRWAIDNAFTAKNAERFVKWYIGQRPDFIGPHELPITTSTMPRIYPKGFVSRFGGKRSYTAMARGRRRGVVQNGRNRTGGFYGRYAGSAKATAAYHGERKFLDFVLSETALDDTASRQILPAVPAIQDNLNQIAIGASEQERIGRYAVIRNISMRLTLGPNDSIARTPPDVPKAQQYRILVILDKQTNGAQMQLDNYLIDDSGLGGINSFRNLESTDRFVPLFDKKYIVPATTVQLNVGPPATNQSAFAKRYVTFNKRCAIKILYNDLFATGQLSTIKSNCIHAFVIFSGDNGFGEINGQWRLRFTDG